MRFPLAHSPAWAAALTVLACVAVSAAPAHKANSTKKASGSWTNPIRASPLGRIAPIKTACPAKFVTALAVDADGALHVATEDQGLFVKVSPTEWKQITHDPNERAGRGRGGVAGGGSGAEPKAWNSLPDPDNTLYGLCFDKAGRLWAGTLRSGVLVCNLRNGGGWRAYSIEEGLPGERVFALASDPRSGDTWVATSGGLARYIAERDAWRVYTRLDGLPSNQVYALAIDAKGTVYAGTDCAGIAIASPKDDYRRWGVAQAPEQFGQCWPVPPACSGKGLPSNQINCMCCLRDGTVLAGTAAGLAWSRDAGKTWQFSRGEEWAEKVKRFYTGGVTKRQAPKMDIPSVAEAGRLLPEDYVTALAQDGAGHVWVATREKGLAVLEPAQMTAIQFVGATDFPMALQPMPDGDVFMGLYGGGVGVFAGKGGKAPADAAGTGNGTGGVVQFPSALPPPTLAELQAMKMRLAAQAQPMPAYGAAYLEDDWTTQGDWTYRHGRTFSKICAYGGADGDKTVSFDQGGIGAHCWGQIGPQASKDDGLRHWVHWAVTDNPRSLYAPWDGIRRQAEWDDHGEVYPRTLEGPDIWVWLSLPNMAQVAADRKKGFMLPDPAPYYRVTLYFFNKDGHGGPNRFRDYLVEVRSAAGVSPKLSVAIPKEKFHLSAMGRPFQAAWRWLSRQSTPETESACDAPVIARTRVRDFWGGVYKSFIVRGPGPYYIRIARNYSFNTIVSAVMVDMQDGSVPLDEKQTYPPRLFYKEPAVPRSEGVAPAMDLWMQAGARCYMMPNGVDLRNEAKRTAYRFALGMDASWDALCYFRWFLNRWEPEDRRYFVEEMARAWAHQQSLNPGLKSRERCPYSPGVIYDTVVDARKAEGVPAWPKPELPAKKK